MAAVTYTAANIALVSPVGYENVQHGYAGDDFTAGPRTAHQVRGRDLGIRLGRDAGELTGDAARR